MILEKILLQAFGPFDCQLEVPRDDVFSDRINVISGDNETGKTTLFTVLHHVFFTPYRSAAEEIRRMQTWGTDLSPWAEVRFRSGDRRFLIKKRFLGEPGCVLSEWRDGRYHPIADGDSADQRIREFLHGEKPHGSAKSEHRGLARLLWVPQGETVPPEIEGDLRIHVEKAMNVVTLDEGENRLIEQVQSLYDQYWTSTGRLKKGSGIPGMQADMEKLKTDLNEISGRLADMEQSGNDLKQVQQKMQELNSDKKILEKKRESLSSDVNRIIQLRTDIKRAETDLEKWEKLLEIAASNRQKLDQAKETVKETEQELEGIQIPLEAVETRCSELQVERDGIRKQVQDAEKNMSGIEKQYHRARRVRQARDLQAEVEALTGRLDKVESISERIEDLKKAMATRPNPRQKDINTAREMEQDLQKIAGQLEATGLTITLAAESDQTGVFCDDSGEEKPFTGKQGETVSFSAARRARLVLHGVGEIGLSSGSREVAEIERRKADLEERLQNILGRFSAESASDLERLSMQCERDGQALDRLNDELKAHLGRYEHAGALRKAVADSRRNLAALMTELDMTLADLTDDAKGELESLEGDLDAARDRLSSLRSCLNGVEQELEEAKSRRSQLVDKRNEMIRKKEWNQETINSLVDEFGSEERIEDEYRKTRRERDAVRDRLEDLTAQLPSEDEDPEKELDRVKTEIDTIAREIQELIAREAGLQEKINSASDSGLYEQVASKEEELTNMQEKHDAAVRKARAVKLLHGILTERRQRITRELSAPVSSRVGQYLERISGRIGRDIRYDDTLKPVYISDRAVDEADVTLLSAGAREQLYLLTRLAMARYLAQQDGRTLFVLDDSLVNTDSTRHTRLLGLLEEAADDLQIVILTCHPQRYRGLADARHELL